MKEKKCWMLAGRLLLGLSLALCLSFGSGSVFGAEGIDPEADRILRSMSSYLAGASAFSVTADVDNEIITREGQKLQLSASASMVLKRPAGLYAERKGMFADVALFFDGKTLTLYGKKLNAFAQVAAAGEIDDAIRTLEMETGVDAPGADLLFSDPYAILSAGVEQGTYLGIAYVGGVACHHLAFREAQLDWQLWVQDGDAPLPMKYVITSKWQTAAPQYAVRLHEWNMNPQIDADRFTFTAPQGATKLDTLPVNEMGEVTLEEE